MARTYAVIQQQVATWTPRGKNPVNSRYRNTAVNPMRVFTCYSQEWHVHTRSQYIIDQSSTSNPIPQCSVHCSISMYIYIYYNLFLGVFFVLGLPCGALGGLMGGVVRVCQQIVEVEGHRLGERRGGIGPRCGLGVDTGARCGSRHQPYSFRDRGAEAYRPNRAGAGIPPELRWSVAGQPHLLLLLRLWEQRRVSLPQWHLL